MAAVVVTQTAGVHTAGLMPVDKKVPTFDVLLAATLFANYLKGGVSIVSRSDAELQKGAEAAFHAAFIFCEEYGRRRTG